MEKRKAYEEKLQAQLDEWAAKIDTLKAKASKAEADAKVNYHETIEELEKKRADAKKRLQEFREASDDAWTELKSGLDKAWSNLGSAVKSATEKFK